MRDDLTHLLIIVDCSSSMFSIADEASAGINQLIEQQKKNEGECRLSILEFSGYDNIVYALDDVDINEVEPYTLRPGGMTALNDAMGKGITELGQFLRDTPKRERPGLVIVATMTDGMENNSRLYNDGQIAEMVKTQEDVYNWEFTYLGANQNSVQEATKRGFKSDKVADYSGNRIMYAVNSLSNNVTRMRSAKKKGREVVCSYTAEEKSDMA